MPVKNGIGYGEWTRLKNDHFTELIKVHTRICKKISLKHTFASPSYQYIDFNAGTGYHPEEEYPTAIPTTMHYLNEVGMNGHFHLIEMEKDNCNELNELWGANPDVNIYCGDHNKMYEKVLESIPFQRGDKKNDIDSMLSYGLLYYDPSEFGSGGDWHSMRTIGACSRAPQMSRIDILIYVSANMLKRVKHLIGGYNLTYWLNSINKEYWIIRKPEGKEQWTFLLGTNWKSYPDFRHIGFHRKDSKEGKSYMEVLTYSEKARKEMYQLKLFS